jgi:hypothetical protein
MTDPQQQSTPPAWYPDPDPANPGGQRWWDGVRWTEHTRPTTRPSAAPAPAYGQPQTTGAYGQTAGYGQASGYQSASGYVQPSAYQQAVGYGRVSQATSSLTWSVWLVVGLPLLVSIAFMFVDFTGYFRSIFEISLRQDSYPSTPVLPAAFGGFFIGVLLIDLLGFVVYGLTVVFAYVDHRDLQRRGFVRPFHWAWTFLSPLVYVIGRTVVARRRGGMDALWPIWGLVAVTVIGIVLVIVKLSMTMSALAGIIAPYTSSVS